MKLKYCAISKVLPCVYDDSLSYYEVLCKVRDKLNEVIDIDNAQSEAINDLGEQSTERYNEFEQKIIRDLEEMENKLEGEITAGDDEVLQTLNELITNLSNEIDDVSATISGIESSVADVTQTVNETSEAVNELSGDVETVTQNVADLSTAMGNVDSSLQQLNRNVNANADAIANNASAISSLDGRVTDIEEEIEGGMVFADVDSALSTTSTNPVENQVITRKIQQVEGDIPTQLSDLSDVNFTNPSSGQVAGFDANGNLVNTNLPAGVTVVDNLNSQSASDALSANQGRILKSEIDAIVVPSVVDALNSQSASDALSANQGRILKQTIDALPVPPAVIDALNSQSASDALSANQGRILKNTIDALPTPPAVIDSLNSTSTTAALSANQGRLLGESVANGKSAIALAITNKGVPTSGTDTFAQMAANIGNIASGLRQATGRYGTDDVGLISYYGTRTISFPHGLGVTPQFVICRLHLQDYAGLCLVTSQGASGSSSPSNELYFTCATGLTTLFNNFVNTTLLSGMSVTANGTNIVVDIGRTWYRIFHGRVNDYIEWVAFY